MKKSNRVQRVTVRLLSVLFLLLGIQGIANSQLIDVKPWSGTYPDMNGSYPLTFVSFKGILFSTPYIFVRTWPTHYYINAESLPVTDATETAGEIRTGFLRLAGKLLEREFMKGRFEKSEGIQLNTSFQKEIVQILFDARSDRLEDNYRLADGFIKLYGKIGLLRKGTEASGLAELFEREADVLAMRFMLVNLLKTAHGEKLKAFSEILAEQNRLAGEAGYTLNKIRYYSSMNALGYNSSYTFLTR